MAGHEIPQIARAIAVADAFDAMTTTRNYRCRRSPQEALTEIRRCVGHDLGPEMVEAFLAAIDTNASMINQIIQQDVPAPGERFDPDHGTSADQHRTARAPIRGSDR